MAEKPRVSVIIVNWNGAEHLRICLPSLASQSFESLEIIVVDASPDWEANQDLIDVLVILFRHRSMASVWAKTVDWWTGAVG